MRFYESQEKPLLCDINRMIAAAKLPQIERPLKLEKNAKLGVVS